MSTVRKETEDERDQKNQSRERGGQTQEDRSKGLEGQSTGPFDDTESNPKRKE